MAGLTADSHWQALAKAALRDDLASIQRHLTADALRGAAQGADAAQTIADWERGNQALLEHFRRVLADMGTQGAIDLAMASVAMRELRNISARA